MFGLFKKKIPHCDDLFKKYLSPWYPKDDRPKAIRPDIYTISAYEKEPLNLDKIQYLPSEILKEVKEFINDIMKKASLEDFQYVHKTDKPDLKLLDAIDKYYDRQKIKELIESSNPSEYGNNYLVAVCELGVMLGELLKETEDCDWLYSYPYFHSIIVHKETGLGITVFDWAVKKFSEYGVDDGLVAKFNKAKDIIAKSKSE